MDFLSNRSEAAIRRELIGIRDSYHHYWDLLAELLQNSRDAITRKRNAGHVGPFFISISVDAASNSIEVMDNGSGISSSLLAEMLAPGGGDKGIAVDRPNEVGEKGVGLTYVVFSCNDFLIATKTTDDVVVGGKVVNAQRWLSREQGVNKPIYEDQAVAPQPETIDFFEKSYPLDSFTRISASAVMPPDGDVNIFHMTPQQLRLLIRTRTAVGVTASLFCEDVVDEFDVFLSMRTTDGIETNKISSTFAAPHLLVPSEDLIPLQVVRDAFVSRGDPALRRRYLKGKTIWACKSEKVGGWDVFVYAVMFPDNDALRQLSDSVMGVPVSEQEDMEGSALLQTGIFVGTKGMPTGMRISPKPGAGRYPAYYKRCFFFVESPSLKFDLGRKSLHYRHVNKLQAAVAQTFSLLEEIAPFQGDARVEAGPLQTSQAERRMQSQSIWRDAKSLPDLNEPAIRYAKHPNAQEAAVAAIFHELVGASVLKSYMTLRTGYGERYDVHARYVEEGRELELVIEFKYSLQSLVRDLSVKQKHFNDIDLLIAWDADVVQLKNSGFILETSKDEGFEGVTHVLTVPVPGIDPIPVILLRTLLDQRRRAS